jgi:transposase
MAHVTGKNRFQSTLFPPTLEEYVDDENPVRVIDAFVEAFDLNELGFQKIKAEKTGRPPYHPGDLLKLYLYGYINGIRRSRKLEKECCRNVEVMWLLKNVKPKYHTISDFRKDHSKQIKKIFRLFVLMIKDWGLIGGDTVAIDGSKFRAVNSKKNNYNLDKIKRHLNYIDNKIEEHFEMMDKADNEESVDDNMQEGSIKDKIKELKQRKEKYKKLEKELKKSDEDQVSTSDPDSKALIIRRNIVEVSYNAQTAVDDKHNLIVNYKNINSNDRKILGVMATETKEALNTKTLTVLADKGYHNGEELQTCKDNDIVTYVAPQKRGHSKPVPTFEYYGDKFEYNEKDDCYFCPQGEILSTTGTLHKKTYKGGSSFIFVKNYKTRACKTCQKRHLCTTSPRGRVIQRSIYEKAVQENNKRVEKEMDKYLKRQQIVEHPFGTIKRQWGYDYVLLKGLNKVEGELGLIFTAYNLRRLISIIGVIPLVRRFNIFLSQIRKLSAILSKYRLLNDFRINTNINPQTLLYTLALVLSHLFNLIIKS